MTDELIDELTDEEVALTVSASTAPPQEVVTQAVAQDLAQDVVAQETAPQEAAPQEPAPQRSRGADTRALTQVLFGQLKVLEPGTPEHNRVRGALIEANLPLVRYAAARFRSRNEPMEDVVQVGTIGLINAIDRFDPDRGVQFPTFAMPTIAPLFPSQSA